MKRSVEPPTREAQEAPCQAGKVIAEQLEERTRVLTLANKKLKKAIRERLISQKVVDVTEQKHIENAFVQPEKEFRHAQKMQAIGTLADGIAHDFNNIIAGIIGFTEMVLEDVPADSALHRRLDFVLKGAYRGRDLARQLLAFSRRREQERKAVSMGLIINEVLPLIRASLPATIDIRQNLLIKADLVAADQAQIHQAIINICTNAAYAMREHGGVLDITLTGEDIDVHSPCMDPCLKPGPYVRLTIGDTGCGMEPELMKRIFDPFFTTKAPGEGIGLGLSVARNIIKGHEGTISVESEPGQGSFFHVYLPRIISDPSTETEGVSRTPGGKESILIVDDEELLIEMNRQRLEKLGYTVVGTTRGTEALEMFRNEPDKFDLVITDYTMPHMIGTELAEEIHRIKPGTPIILCSGLNEPVPAGRLKEIGIQEFFVKPVGKNEFAKLIRRVLDKT